MDTSEKADLEAIGLRFRKVRLMSDMTQADLGDILGLNRTTITNIEKGVQGPTLKTLTLLYENFGVSIPWLLTGVRDIDRLTGPDQKRLKIVTAYLEASPEFLNEVCDLLTGLWKPLIDSKVFDKPKKSGKSDSNAG